MLLYQSKKQLHLPHIHLSHVHLPLFASLVYTSPPPPHIHYKLLGKFPPMKATIRVRSQLTSTNFCGFLLPLHPTPPLVNIQRSTFVAPSHSWHYIKQGTENNKLNLDAPINNKECYSDHFARVWRFCKSLECHVPGHMTSRDVIVGPKILIAQVWSWIALEIRTEINILEDMAVFAKNG